MSEAEDAAAEKIWLVLETLAAAHPDTRLQDAVPWAQDIWAKVEWKRENMPVLGPNKWNPAWTRDVYATAAFAAKQKSVTDCLPHKKINAIKELRAATGIGLKESKDAIEELFRDPLGYGLAL